MGLTSLVSTPHPPDLDFFRSRTTYSVKGVKAFRCLVKAGEETAFDGVARTAKSIGQEAGKRLKKAYVAVEGNVKQTAAGVNERFNVRGKAHQAAERISEQAQEVDQRVGVKRRLRNLADDLQRKFPQWRRRYSEFSKTSIGQATFLAGVFLLFYTGIAFKILNLLFILWWLAPFLFLVFNKFSPQATQRAEQRQQAAREAQARQNAFFQNPFFTRQQQQGQPPSSSKRRTYNEPGSKVIDVDYTTIDEH